MLLKVFKSKIHRARVTGADVDYEGSIAIDKDLLEAANIYKNEAVWVWNITNGKRLMTYVIEADSGSGEIRLNGAAAHLCAPEDYVIITTFADMTPEALQEFEPTVVVVDDNNKLVKILSGSGHNLPLSPSLRHGQQLPGGGFVKLGNNSK